MATLIASKHYERKILKDKIKHELYSKKRIEHTEAFIYAVSKQISNAERREITVSIRTMIFAYIDKSLHRYVDDINQSLVRGAFDDASKLLSEFCKKLKVFD